MARKIRLVAAFAESSKDFAKFNKMVLLGVVGGIISSIFSLAYSDLQSQIKNSWALLGASLFVTIVWYFIAIFILLVIYLLFKMFTTKWRII